MVKVISLLLGWVLDLMFGDPQRLPHPIVWFGKVIAWGEHHLNHGLHRRLKGALMAVFLIVLVFALTWILRHYISSLPSLLGRGWGWVFLFDALIEIGRAHV